MKKNYEKENPIAERADESMESSITHQRNDEEELEDITDNNIESSAFQNGKSELGAVLRLETKGIEMEYIGNDNNTEKRMMYFTEDSMDFIFQHSLHKMKHLTLKHTADFRLVHGHNSDLYQTRINLTSLIKLDQYEIMESKKKFESNIKGIKEHCQPILSHTIDSDTFYPRIDSFLDLDFEELLTYMKNKQEKCYYNYTMGVIELRYLQKVKKHPQNSHIEHFRKGSHHYCHASTIQYMKYLTSQISSVDDPHCGDVITMYTNTIMYSGIYDATQTDRSENNPSLVKNFFILLDCSPFLRSQVLKRVSGLIQNLSKSLTIDLFDYESQVWRQPSLVSTLVLYLFVEIDKSDINYLKCKTVLEYLVKTCSEWTFLGVALGDLYEMENTGVFPPTLESKLVGLYREAYSSTCDSKVTGICALSRLMVIYNRQYLDAQRDPNTPPAEKLESYMDLLHAHTTLASQTGLPDSNRFLINHFFRCLVYVTDPDRVKRRYHREFDNLMLNRRLALFESLQHFDFFVLMGDRSELLLEYYYILKYLNFIEAGLAAFRFAVLSQSSLSHSKRFYYYAECKLEGLGCEQDLKYSAKVFLQNFLESTQDATKATFLQTSIYLYNMSQVAAKLQHTVDQEFILRESINLLLHSEKVHKPTKELIFYLCTMLNDLNKIIQLNLVGKENHDKNERGAMDPQKLKVYIAGLWLNGYYLACTTNKDFIYHYFIESDIASNLYQYQSIENGGGNDQMEDLQELKNFGLTEVSEKCKEKQENIKQILSGMHETFKIDHGRDGVARYLNKELIPIIQRYCEKAIGDVEQPIEENEGSSHRRKITRKKLTILVNKESSLGNKSATNNGIFDNFGYISKKLDISSLENKFQQKLAKEDKLRVIKDSELDLNMGKADDSFEYYEGVFIFRSHFKKNGQICRVFQMRISKEEEMESILFRIDLIKTQSPFILNYYGINCHATDSDLVVSIISEDFEGIAVDLKGMNVWLDPRLSETQKWGMFHDLLLAIQSLHFVGIVHRLITPRHMVVKNNKREERPALKLIIPFFLPYFSNPASYTSKSSLLEIYYISPAFLSQPISIPDIDLLRHDIRDNYKTWFYLDIWSLAVIYLETFNQSRLFSHLHLTSPEDYLKLAKNKSQLKNNVEVEFSRTKRGAKGRTFPSKDIMRMMLPSEKYEKITVHRVVEMMEGLITSLGVDAGEIQEKKSENYFRRAVYLDLRFIDEGEERDEEKEEPVKRCLLLPNRIEYQGEVSRFNEPHGKGVMIENRTVLMEGTFKKGFPAENFSIYNRKGQMVSVHEIEGKITHCESFCQENRIEFSHELVEGTQVKRPDIVLEAFTKFSSAQTYEDKVPEQKKANFLEKTTTTRTKILNSLMKMKESVLKVGPDINDEGRSASQVKGSGSERNKRQEQDDSDAKPNRSSSRRNLEILAQTNASKLVNLKYEKVLERLNLLLKCLNERYIQFEENKKEIQNQERKKNEASTMNLSILRKTELMKKANGETEISKDKKLVKPFSISVFFDPFGFIYHILNNSFRDTIQYTKGFVRTSHRIDHYSSILTTIPDQSGNLVLISDIFESKLCESVEDFKDFRILQAATVGNSCTFSHCVSTDHQGNHFRGRLSNGVYGRGSLVAWNGRLLEVNTCEGNRIQGSMVIPLFRGEEYRHSGYSEALKLSGTGTLVSLKTGKKVFEGVFENDLPHGYGYLYDRKGERGPEGFEGCVWKGCKLFGRVEGKGFQLEGLFKPEKLQKVYTSEYDPSLYESLSHSSKRAEVTGWFSSKTSGAVVYGKMKEEDSLVGGLFKVIYSNGQLYKGYFSGGNKDGPFIMVTKDGNVFVGRWERFGATGVVLWGSNCKIERTVGNFEMNSDGELEPQGWCQVRMRSGAVYIGEVRGNKFEGLGRIDYPDGTWYVGQFLKGVYSGVGELFDSKTGNLYRGEFKKNSQDGLGVCTYQDGNFIKGIFKGSFCCESVLVEDFKGEVFGAKIKSLVTQTKFNNETNMFEFTGVCIADLEPRRKEKADSVFEYQGEIFNGKITGNGTILEDSAIVYQGRFRDGKLDGFGNENFRTSNSSGNNIYSGEYSMNMRSGIGVWRAAQQMYEGKFINFEKTGVFLIYLNREKWQIGNYNNDKKNGWFIMNDEKKIKDKVKDEEPFTVEIYSNGKYIPPKHKIQRNFFEKF